MDCCRQGNGRLYCHGDPRWRPAYGSVQTPMVSRVVTINSPLDCVSLQEAKAHCRVDIDDDDSYLTALIEAAVEYVQGATNTAVAGSSVTIRYEQLPPADTPLVASLGPLDESGALPTVKYLSTDGTVKTLSMPADFAPLQGTALPSFAPVGGDWPTDVDTAETHGVILEYMAGVSASRSLKHAVLLLVANWYSNREPSSSGQARSVPYTLDILLASGGDIYFT